MRGRARAWLFVAAGIALSACAHMEPSLSSARVWQSESREPVWVRHPPGPSGGSFYLVREGVSLQNDARAEMKARKSVSVFLVDRLRSAQFRLSVEKRNGLIRTWMGGMETKAGPLLVSDRFAYRERSRSGQLESHVWILAKIPSGLISSLKERYSAKDRETMRLIDRIHARLNRAIGLRQGFTILRLLSRNRDAFGRIHSFRSFSHEESRHLSDLYFEESEYLSQFLETAEVVPPRSVRLPIPVRVNPFRAFDLSLKTSFSIGKSSVLLPYVRPVLTIRPIPEPDPYPPLVLYQRGRGVRDSPVRWTALLWGSDLARFQKDLLHRTLAYECPSTDGTGRTVCRIRQMPIVASGSRFDIGLERGSGSRPDGLDRILAKVRSRVPIFPEDERYLHRLILRVVAQDASLESSTDKILTRALSIKGYRLGSEAAASESTATLLLRLRPRVGRHVLPDGTEVVDMRIEYVASVVGSRGGILWKRRGHVLDAGLSREEAFSDAVDALAARISGMLDPDLWPRPKTADLSRFRTLRYPVLDGLALCSGETS
jgi:hypothetical protein